ncbi:MAG: transketolase [Elusimicrobia bacterium RIFCSPLOWO2_01_FULL_54_10]|nr:MAG: transketolase [Elusimicrobia bacterium RIFCSPLOWO2_01_FULL_54_10]
MEIRIEKNALLTNPANHLDLLARQIRCKAIEISCKGASPHVGSALSCVDILVAAYWGAMNIDPQHPNSPDRDRFILSKGHAATAIYAALAYRGFFPMDFLGTYNRENIGLPEHPSPRCAPGIEMSTGSLGHALSVGIGMALASRINGVPYRSYVLMGDGECNEGSVWEAALFAPAHRIDNVIAIIDYNKWQASGRSDEVMSLNPLKQKWESFGWSAQEVDGHDIGALIRVLKNVPDPSGKPVAVIAHTVKGKGVSFMEDDNNWHYRIPNEEDFIKAKKELLP